jgi:xanthine dehydrogenase accessory factor
LELNLMRVIAEKMEANEDVALTTVISQKGTTSCSNGTMIAVDGRGEVIGGSLGEDFLDERVAKEALNCLNRGISHKALISLDGSSVEVFINVLCNHDRLIIAGAGNVAHHVYRYARILGYKVTILDNRAEKLTRERFPEANELILGDMVANISSYNISPRTAIVIASHHHEFDEAILQAVINSSASYIGMLSNRRKAAEIFNRLKDQGVSEELIARAHSPIGLDLGGKKTAEIAMAIMAEIQATKYGRTFSVEYPQK